MEWGSLVPVVSMVLLLCAVVPIVWLYARRRWLGRDSAMFDCELNLGSTTHPRWILGVARCSGDDLEWFPLLSLGLRPTRTLSRRGSGIRARTQCSEGDGLNAQRVMRLESDTGMSPEVLELALDSDAVTGLLAWLEAAPPSVGRFSS